MQLRYYRQKAGLSIAELAAKMAVDATTISRWETCKRYPDAKALITLSQILNCTVDELLSNPTSTPPEERAAGENRKAS